jgi:nitrite reductase/ring-hydroxylating ferredoxin subunit
MPLVDDLSLPLTEEELSRRKFLSLVGSGAIAIAGVGTAVTALNFLEPPVLFEEDTRVGLGRPEDIAVGAVLVLPKHKVFVVRSADGFFALSSTCTHLGCMTRYDGARGEIDCPCHGSRFRVDGSVLAGPAPRHLPRLHLTVERGVLVVDTSRQVAPDFLLKVVA